MQYMERYVNGVLVIDFSGRLELEEEAGVLHAFAGWVKEEPNLVFDCRGLEFVDSSGLGILLRLLKRVIALGGDIRLAAINEQVRMLFEITRADQIFKIFSTVDEAVCSYGEQ